MRELREGEVILQSGGREGGREGTRVNCSIQTDGRLRVTEGWGFG